MAALLLPAALAACSLVDPHNVVGRQMGEATGPPSEVVPDAGKGLGVEGRTRAFDFVWSTIHERYHDATYNGTDWDAIGARYRPLALGAPSDDAFWDLLDRMTGELHDSHTRVESPKQVELRNRDESVTLGLAFNRIDDGSTARTSTTRLTVSGVHPDSDAWWAGVRPGMRLIRIGDEDAEAAYAKLKESTRYDSTERSRHLRTVRRLTTGEPGSSVAFTFERLDGTRFDAVLARRKVAIPATESHRVLPSGFGYLRFTQWNIGIMGRVFNALEDLKHAPGLIIDLRNNGGGSVHAVNQILERFFTKGTLFGRTTTRTGKPVSLFFGAVEIIKLRNAIAGRPDAYDKPVVILVNAGSASGSELFAAAMQSTGRAKVVGEPSCGCLLGFLGYARVPGGAELAYSEVGFVLANGTKIEGRGVIPDAVVTPSRIDLSQYRDRTLETAQQLLATLAAVPAK